MSNLPEPNTKPTQFPVVGRRDDGSIVFYSGKAGQDFITTNAREAFGYFEYQAASARAHMLNKGSRIHGIHFFPAQGLGTVEALSAYQGEAVR